jgi:ABC-type amino acid transport substrate-binding protein
MNAEYEVVWPLGRSAHEEVSLAPRLADLEGKTICELSHFEYRGDEIFPAVEDALRKRYKDIKFVSYETFGNFRDPRNYGGAELEKYPGLRDLLLKHKCDAVIAGVGA